MDYYIAKIRLDATNKQFVIEVVNDATGVVDLSWGQVVLKLGKVPMGAPPESPETTMGQPLAIRETIGCDPATGAPRYCFMVRSPWVDSQITLDPET